MARYTFEVVFISMFDVGRSIDLARTSKLVPASQDVRIIDTRDTPASLSIPVPLLIEIDRRTFGKNDPFASLQLQGKIYEEGVVSMIARVTKSLPLTQLHTVRGLEFEIDGERTTIRRWMHEKFQRLLAQIKPAVTKGEYFFETVERETYTAFCLIDEVKDPGRFLKENDQYLSTFLLGERPDIELHGSQIDSTLRHTFSFKKNDLMVLDLDRCFIIDPDRSYDDVLLILELANYQLLELRTLDKLLDRWLDLAEDDINEVFIKRSHRSRRLAKRIGGLLPLRLDALFILENLENTSKIIGDYYLGQVYDHLCALINTAQWELSVRRRLDALQSIYQAAKVDVNERLLIFMEVLVVLLFAIEIVALFLPFLTHR